MCSSTCKDTVVFALSESFSCHDICCKQVDGKMALKFALCYGFRNLQNIVRKVKINKCDYDFVEVMACPSGTAFFVGYAIHSLMTHCLVGQ